MLLTINVNPVQTIPTAGIPVFSTNILARATAGAQDPQHPFPTMAASHPIALSFSGIEANTFSLNEGS